MQIVYEKRICNSEQQALINVGLLFTGERYKKDSVVRPLSYIQLVMAGATDQ